MLKEERIKLKGLLYEKRKSRKALRLRGDGLVISLRNHLDPYKELTELRCDLIAMEALELQDLWRKAKDLEEQIKRLEEDLGEEDG